MSLLSRVNVAHVLKPEKVADFPRWNERRRSEVTRYKRQSAERNGVELGVVGDRLFEGVFFRIIPGSAFFPGRFIAAGGTIWSFISPILREGRTAAYAQGEGEGQEEGFLD